MQRPWVSEGDLVQLEDGEVVGKVGHGELAVP